MDNFIRKEWLLGRTSRAAATRRHPILADPKLNDFWVAMRDGDELRYFKTPPETWAKRMGREGIVILRDGQPIAHFSLRMN